MQVSVVINTCSLGPRAHEITGSTTPSPHAWRAYALEHIIIPAYIACVDEVIVVGEWYDDPRVTYVPCASRFFSCLDALEQRQRGFEATSGDVIAFVHDDHFLEPWAFSALRWWESDVFVPTRWRWIKGVKMPQNNGAPEYVMGHAAIYRRHALELAPWGKVPKVHTWDVEHTRMLEEAGMQITFTEDAEVVDLEVAI